MVLEHRTSPRVGKLGKYEENTVLKMYCKKNTVLYENVKMQCSKQKLNKKQLSAYNKYSPSISTGNALNSLNEFSNVMDQSYAVDSNEIKRAANEISVLPNTNRLTSITIMVIDTISSVKSRKILKVLLDSGSTTTLINRKCLPKNCHTCKIKQKRKISTLAGSFGTSEMVTLHNLRLPEMDKNRNIEQIEALVFDAKHCSYDLILGTDFLSKTGIDIKYSTRTMKWFDDELPLRDPSNITDKEILAMTGVL